METVRALGLIFAGGLGLVLLFGRRDLGAALRGELGQRYLSWLALSATFLAASSGGPLGVTLFALLLGLLSWREYARWPLPRLLGLSWIGAGVVGLTLAGLRGTGLALGLGVAGGLADVGAYSLGRLCGRHPICPAVHPRKSWEGVAGSLLGAAVGLAAFRFVLPVPGAGEILFLALLIGGAAAAGDLLSSALKRRAGIKDWGELLPGHGGALDRMNSLALAVPAGLAGVLLLG